MLERELLDREAVAQVQKFVTRIWMHPLLKEETQYFRLDNLSAVDEVLYANNLQDDIVAFPQGGANILGLRPGSDADFVFFARKGSSINGVRGDEAVSELKGLFYDKGHNQIDVLGLCFPDKHFPGRSPWGNNWYLAVPLVTPDELVAGNVNLAREIRRKIVDKTKDRDWNSLKRDFREAYNMAHLLGWPHDNYLNKLKRIDRLQRLIKERSEMSLSQEKWASALRRSWFSYDKKFPEQHVWQQALEATGGSLSVDSRYFAQGIDVNR